MPRMSAGYLGGYSFGTDFSSGFSDHVQLGQIGQIQQSNAVVMHIQIDGDTVGRYDLHWRGVALAEFRWTHLVQSERISPSCSASPITAFQVPRFQRCLTSYVTASQVREEIDPLPRPDGADRHQRFFPRSLGPQRQRRLPAAGGRFRRRRLQPRQSTRHQPL